MGQCSPPPPINPLPQSCYTIQTSVTNMVPKLILLSFLTFKPISSLQNEDVQTDIINLIMQGDKQMR